MGTGLLVSPAFANQVNYIPSWFPGAGFKRRAASSRQLSGQVQQTPFDASRELIVRPLLADRFNLLFSC